MAKLKGMTWNHVRGYAPLLAVTELFREQYPECDIEWDRRSLKDFGDYPVDELANEYDIILIDHPHVGISAAKGVLVPLDTYIPADYLQEQEANSMGPSHQSYQWDGHQWAMAVDAAAQVASYRPDLLGAADVPRSWQQLLKLAKSLPKGRKVGWPLCPTDAMCSFLTLCAGIGGDGFFDETAGIPAGIGEAAIEQMIELLPLLHESSIASNPIQMYDHMGSQDDIVFIPLGFGYSNFAREGFATHLLRFSDIPTASGEPKGSLLGGVGMAVSAFSAQIPLAVQFAMFTASEAVQRTVYVECGGQPGHRSAWRDDEVNRYCHRFFADTQRTMELSYMRPRNQAFPAFQEEAGVLLHAALLRRLAGEAVDGEQTITEMNRCYDRAISIDFRKST
jgi:multiple sugar transport system substrate-binding protein